MRGPQPTRLVLSAPQRAVLERLSRRPRSRQGLVRRVRIVLAASTPANNAQIAGQLGVRRDTVAQWRGRWLAAGPGLSEIETAAGVRQAEAAGEAVALAAGAPTPIGEAAGPAAPAGPEVERALERAICAALADAPRPGAPATFTAEQICQIVAVACEPPAASDRPVSHWTPAELAAEAITRGLVAAISARSVGRFLKGGRPQTASGPGLAPRSAGR